LSWIRNIFRQERGNSDKLLSEIQKKFSVFLDILDTNNQILSIISDLEEKSQGEYLFDINYITKNLKAIREGIRGLIEKLIFIGGEEYLPLKDKFSEIDAGIDAIIGGNRALIKDDFTIPIKQLNKERAYSVGSKIAQLGEISSKLGLSVPEGFAITSWAYKHFVDRNNLQEQISKSIHKLDIKNYDDLIHTSDQIQTLIKSSAVPADLGLAIKNSFSDLKNHSPAKGFAVRSSALGEDTIFSFAGQYATFLNVKENEIIDRYREVLASKFTPKAIYYFLSHSLSEAELAMSVGCMEMINSAISGVLYTLDPVHPEEQCLLINAIYGLGKYLVDGTVTPDVFKVSKQDGSVKETRLALKSIKLIMNEGGGIKQEPVPESMQGAPSIDQKTIKLLVDTGLDIERHYGCPQDIEWAIDHNNRLFILQTRPLRVIKTKNARFPADVSRLNAIITGGTTVCPGAGTGLIYHADTPHQLASVPDGAILITHVPFPGIIMVMSRVRAIVTEQGGSASHMATIAREYRIPTLTGVQGAAGIPAGKEVTVDATGAVIYAGKQEQLVEARQLDYDPADQSAIFELIKKVLTRISTLNLIDATAEDFKPGNCKTFHDITRFVHQKAMEEMFHSCSAMGCKEDIGVKLKTGIPMSINIIYIDRTMADYSKNKWIEEDHLDSVPMTAFWNGVKKEGWPSTPSVNLSGLISVMSTQMLRTQQNDFLEKSFAILGKEYMLLGLHMGYHFSTVEAMCTDDGNKNYIRMQYKDGGAALDRRVRRIRVLSEILSDMGFSNITEADFLDSSVHYQSCSFIVEKLQVIGRLTMMFKQLDMALANDSVAQWYKADFLKRLNLQKNTT
jgi:pyruvate,water dikinase